MKRYIRANTNTGVPDTMPTKAELLAKIRQLHGEELSDAISRLDSLGTFYREDKRQKRQYLIEVVENNYTDDPADDYYPADAISTNCDLIYVVTNIPSYSPQFGQTFGHYDIDTLYKRARSK